VTRSLSQSAAAEQASDRSPVLLVVTFGLVAATVRVLAGVFERLSDAVLAAAVIHAVSGMVGLAPLTGVLIGVAASFVLLIRRLDHPLRRRSVGRLMARPKRSRRRTARRARFPGVLIYAFRASLVFANGRVRTDRPQPVALVLD
jgi:MFS superfamily sulfate permease-like transporter